MKRALLVLTVFLAGCNLFFFLPAAREGKHYTQTLTADDVSRLRQVASCAQAWARANGYPSADYSAVDTTSLTIVGVGDPGVVDNPNDPRDFVAGRESGDTVFIPLRTLRGDKGLAAAILRHEDLHIVQQQHPELEGPNHYNHWAPPFDYCRIPIVIFTSV